MQVLRLVLTCLCDPLFHKASSEASPSPVCPPPVSRWLSVATSADCPHAASLFYSLLNTVVGFDPVGWGLPYARYANKSGPASRMQVEERKLVLTSQGWMCQRVNVGAYSYRRGSAS